MSQRIALFIPDLRIGGAERVFLTLAKAFVERGHTVDLVLARAEGELLSEAPRGARVVDLGATELRFGLLGLGLSTVLKLTGYLKREQPQAMLSTLTGANLVAVMARSLARVDTRLVLREASSLRNLRHAARFHLMCLLYPGADAVVALTQKMGSELSGKLGLSPSKVTVVSNPVDLPKLQASASESLDHAYFERARCSVIVAIGRLVPEKNFPALIQAFALTRQRNAEARLIILGEGALRPELEKLVTDLGLSSEVAMPGFDPNPYRWMSRAQLLAISSLWEGYPNVVLEAMALGVPVVATDYDPSIREILEHSDRASLVPAGDVEALAQALCASLVAERERPKLGLPPGVLNAPDRYLEVLGMAP